MGYQPQYTIDTDLQLKDGGALTATDICQVAGADAIIDLGAADTLVTGDLIIDISAIDVASGNELYELVLEGSESSTFASDIEPLATIELGDSSVVLGDADIDTDVGRYIMPFRNERNGRHYRYLRLHAILAGTTPSITFQAWIGISRN